MGIIRLKAGLIFVNIFFIVVSPRFKDKRVYSDIVREVREKGEVINSQDLSFNDQEGAKPFVDTYLEDKFTFLFVVENLLKTEL